MARSETFDLMCAHADQLGANAIIAVRYDATELMAGLTEVLCYGTAVVVTTIIDSTCPTFHYNRFFWPVR
jgi:uncharacterized protein YbjQ (UPF0145 family)